MLPQQSNLHMKSRRCSRPATYGQLALLFCQHRHHGCIQSTVHPWCSRRQAQMKGQLPLLRCQNTNVRKWSDVNCAVVDSHIRSRCLLTNPHCRSCACDNTQPAAHMGSMCPCELSAFASAGSPLLLSHSKEVSLECFLRTHPLLHVGLHECEDPAGHSMVLLRIQIVRQSAKHFVILCLLEHGLRV